MPLLSLVRDRRGETLISVLVGVFILAITIGAIVMILSTNYELEDTYERNNTLFLLQNNATNIIRKLDTSLLTEKELFSVYKDTENKQFTLFTGSSVDTYKYIDAEGNHITNTGSFAGIIYARYFLIDKKDSSFGAENQVIKAAVRELIRK